MWLIKIVKKRDLAEDCRSRLAKPLTKCSMKKPEQHHKLQLVTCDTGRRNEDRYLYFPRAAVIIRPKNLIFFSSSKRIKLRKHKSLDRGKNR